jgi:hypothetical protein
LEYGVISSSSPPV